MPTRRRLVVRNVNALSVLRFSVLMYLSIWLVVLIAAILLWVVASIFGTVDNAEDFIQEMWALERFQFSAGQMFRSFAIAGLLLVGLGAGLNVLGAVLYNLISDVVGGVELTVLDDVRSTDERGENGDTAAAEQRRPSVKTRVSSGRARTRQHQRQRGKR